MLRVEKLSAHYGPVQILHDIDIAVEGAGHAVTDLSVAAPTLETVFIRLTGKELREK